MEFVLNEEQKILSDTLNRLAPKLAGLEPTERLTAMAEFGLTGLGLDPEEPMIMESVLAAEALGRANVPDVFAFTHIGAAQALARYASFAGLTEEISEGRATVAPAFHEPGRRYDLAPANTRLANGRLNGTKALVFGGDGASHLLASARDGGGQTVLVNLPLDTPGIARRVFTGIDGRSGAEITFADVIVPDAAIVCSGAAADRTIAGTEARISAALVADSVGAMTVLMEMTAEYLQTRKQFGRPIGAFQALQHRFVDMKLAHELARSMMLGAARALESLEGTARTQVIATARLQTAESGRKIGEEAIQMHGAMGMTAEYPAGRYLKRLIVNAASFGDPDTQLDRLTALADAGETGRSAA